MIITNEQQFKRTRVEYLILRRQRDGLVRRQKYIAAAERQDEPLSSAGYAVFRECDEKRLNELNATISSYENAMEQYICSLNAAVDFPPLQQIQHIGDWLIQARLSLNISQKGLAALMGTYRQQIQLYEKTKYSQASLNTIQSAATLLLNLSAENRALSLEPPIRMNPEKIRRSLNG